MIIYDTEIIKAIPDRNTPRIEGIEYCAGWQDFPNMGISVIGAYDFLTDTYHVYLEDNFEDFRRLCDGRTVGGFNSILFDDKLCAANNLPIVSTYDILRETYAAKGLNPFPERFSAEYKGYGLDALGKATINMCKSGHGELAPILWQQGKIGQVIDYCLFDVRITVGLMKRIAARTGVIDPHTGATLMLKHPSSPAAPTGGLLL